MQEEKDSGKLTSLKVLPNPTASGKVADFHTEFTAVKDSLIRDLKKKDGYIETLKAELEKARDLQVKLAKREAEYVKLDEELSKRQAFESEAMELLSEGKKRIYELEEELEKRKMSEKKIHDLFVTQTKQLEETRALLEESRNEMKKSKNLEEEIRVLRLDLKIATDAEENNKKAMDDLALALKEVITEANESKEKLGFCRDELEKTKGEVQNLHDSLMKIQEKHTEAKREVEQLKNISDGLRIEAEESLLAWNGKEKGFVECIKKVEEERNAAKEECEKLIESLNEAENIKIKFKEENQKLRDIMKQAINEANAAKEAAAIAKEENSQLKDALSQKDEALNFLSHENENLKINEAAAFENIAELKRLFSEAKSTSSNTKDWEIEQNKDEQKEQPKEPTHQQRLSGSFLSQKIPFSELKSKDMENTDALKSSIFYSPKTPMALRTHHGGKSSSSTFLDDETTNNNEVFYPLGEAAIDEENERNARKKKALLRRFSDLLLRKNMP